MSNGFSRRWDSGASTVVTRSLLGLGLLDAELDHFSRHRAAGCRHGDELDPVAAGGKAVPVGVAPGQADRDLAGKDVAQARQEAEPLSAPPQVDVEFRERLDLRARLELLEGARLAARAPPASCPMA